MLVERVLAAAYVVFGTLANGQLLLNQYPIEVSVTAAFSNGGVDAEMIIRAPLAVLVSNPYELVFQFRNGTVDFTDLLATFPFRITQERFLAYNLQNLIQDEYYTLQVQLRNVFRGLLQLSSDPFSLLTTGLQRITAQVGFEDAVVTCHFLIGARADGCLVRWSVVNSTLDSGRSLQMSRAANSLVATEMITGLQENSIYTVQAFGTRAGVNLHTDLPIVLPSNLHTLERQTVSTTLNSSTTPTMEPSSPPVTPISTTLNSSTTPTMEPSSPPVTPISTTLNSSTTPTMEPSSPSVTLFLVNIIPAFIVGIVALGVSIIVACACVHTKMKKQRPAQKEICSNNKMPHNLTQIQHNGSNSDNIVPEARPQVYDYIEVRPPSPAYAVADAESCSSSLTASGGEYVYVDKSISFHPSNFSPRVDQTTLTENCAYNASSTRSPAQLPLHN